MATANLTEWNLSYYTIPAAYLLSWLPNTYAWMAAGRNHDPANPRLMTENVAKDEKMPKQKVGRILRAKAASNNGIESIGLYAAALVAANVAGVDAETLNWYSLSYVAFRAVYNYVYIMWDDKKLSVVRSLVWGGSMAVIFSLFIKAARLAPGAASQY